MFSVYSLCERQKPKAEKIKWAGKLITTVQSWIQKEWEGGIFVGYFAGFGSTGLGSVEVENQTFIKLMWKGSTSAELCLTKCLTDSGKWMFESGLPQGAVKSEVITYIIEY